MSSEEWNEAVEYAKEELGVYGYVDPDTWQEVVDLAKGFLREAHYEDYCDYVVSRYQNHINSRDWYLLRKKVLKRDNNKCHDCGEIATTVHHLSYSRLKTPQEQFDCISLCNRCHIHRHKPKYLYTNSLIWISKSTNGHHTVYFCPTCGVQRTFSSVDNPSIFRCDHCKTSLRYSSDERGFEKTKMKEV